MSDPKLIAAMDAIKKIIVDNDIAGHIVLHNAPDRTEIFTRLDPSYSNITGIPPEVRLRSKLIDYGGDSQAQMRDLAATSNMVRSLSEALAINAIALLELSNVIDSKIGVEHNGPLRPDPDPASAH